MHELQTILEFVRQRKAHGAQGARQYIGYGEGMSTAQRRDVHKERIGAAANVE